MTLAARIPSARPRAILERMEVKRVFERHDPVSGDALVVALDAGRLLVRVHVEGDTRSIVLVDERDAGRLRDALARALEGQP